ncbi:MAG: hypothetical protein KIT02_00955 [Devosia sp.]|uniref:hypothetical protein n=1 Tax=Devosia sp. TaxID=1871048 RepID=UPI0024CC6D10|nr:hypothetical protein [Devosia sp.]UYN99844.1 MAG: hypothetical protein KIT02_00955 [Devosia sp.]
MKLRQTMLLVVALAGLGAGAVQAQQIMLPGQMSRDFVIKPIPGTMPMSMRNKGCTFYEHANGGGESWKKNVGWLAQRYDNQDSYAEYVTTVGEWWDNRISSLKCDDSAAVRCSIGVYRDPNKGGGEAIFWGSQGMVNLASYGWDDTISSYMIFCNLMK